jgi:hypothetical protein
MKKQEKEGRGRVVFPRASPPPESGPLKPVHFSRHKWPRGVSQLGWHVAPKLDGDAPRGLSANGTL